MIQTSKDATIQLVYDYNEDVYLIDTSTLGSYTCFFVELSNGLQHLKECQAVFSEKPISIYAINRKNNNYQSYTKYNLALEHIDGSVIDNSDTKVFERIPYDVVKKQYPSNKYIKPLAHYGNSVVNIYGTYDRSSAINDFIKTFLAEHGIIMDSDHSHSYYYDIHKLDIDVYLLRNYHSSGINLRMRNFDKTYDGTSASDTLDNLHTLYENDINTVKKDILSWVANNQSPVDTQYTIYELEKLKTAVNNLDVKVRDQRSQASVCRGIDDLINELDKLDKIILKKLSSDVDI